jgi:hypothetical protein
MSWRGFRRAEARSAFRVQASACVDSTEYNVRFERSSEASHQIWQHNTESEIEWREIGTEDVESSEAAWREARVWRIAATLMPVLILNSMFGNTFTLYSVAPIGWLLVGWISAASLRQTSEQSAP